MKKSTINRTKTPFFSNISNDLVYKQDALATLIHPMDDVHTFKSQMMVKQKAYSNEMRTKLVAHFEKAYQSVEKNGVALEQISALKKETTFTVTTGHQLSLYTGPLFFIYKIIHAINLARELKATYPGFDFVPVYWMASEDHDFEEINHLNVFGSKLVWESQQKGAVGRFKCLDLDEVKSNLLAKFERDEDVKQIIERHYTEENTLAKATLLFVHELFHKEGLLILDADDANLKATFSPYMEKELATSFSEAAVIEQTQKIAAFGYKQQVHPRAINLFYLTENGRERIIKEGDDFIIGENRYGLGALKQLLEKHPENFSPNVILRPLYQEVLLPNLCYIGGGGELAYWAQLKEVFHQSDVVFPLLMVRNSVLLIDKGTQKKITKLGLSITDFFEDAAQLKKRYVLEHPETNLDFESIDEVAEELIGKMELLITEVDPHMVSYAKSESVKLKKQLDQVKTKMVRQQKKQMEGVMQQIDAVYDKLFPNNGLQERYDNFFQWRSMVGGDFLDQLLNCLSPFEKDLIILEGE